MGIEDVKLSVRRILELSLQISHRFLQNHPRVSTALLFFFFFFAFFSYIISFLLYFFPFFSFVAFLLQMFWTSERFNVEDQKQEHDSKSFIKDVCVDTNQMALTSPTRSYKVKHAVSWTAPAGISVQNDASMEESRREIWPDIEKETHSSGIASAPESFIPVQVNNRPFMRSEPSMTDFLAFGGLNLQTHKSNGGYESESEGSEEEEEEEAREDGDKAVKWTEDDQKNLMDLGFSEMERNRRLESLIAKRSGKKPSQGQVEDDVVSMDRTTAAEIAKVSIAKHRPFDVPSNFKEVEGLPIPGSAPSVLLPMRNPFDSAYDPLEEKPNPMTDSFQREFCRHGSFCFGPSFPAESHQNPFFSAEKWDGFGNSRFRRSSPSEKEDNEWLIEPLLFKGMQIPDAEIKEKAQGNNVEFHLRDGSSDATSSSSENLEEMFHGDEAGAPTQSSRIMKDPLYGFGNLPSTGDTIDDCFSFALKAAYHTPTYSIASDLQVEVSEISSPPTLDGTNSPTDGQSDAFDEDIEKETALVGEEIWESSSDVYGRIKNEIKLRKTREDVASIWNPFAAAPDSIDEQEKSSICNGEMKDEDVVGEENQPSDSVSGEPCKYPDNAGSDKLEERDKMLDVIGEREKPSICDGDRMELPKPGEDEESRVESEDAPIIPGGPIMSNVEEGASNVSSSSSPKFKLQEEISIHPNPSSALNSAMDTEMEYKVQSSSSNADSGDKNEDVEEFPERDDENPTLKSSDDTVRLPTETSVEVELLPERQTPGNGILSVAEEGGRLNRDEEATINAESCKPKEEENDSHILTHPAEQENGVDLGPPTIVENKEDASLESENSIKHGGPKDEPDPDDINADSSSPFTKHVEGGGHC